MLKIPRGSWLGGKEGKLQYNQRAWGIMIDPSYKVYVERQWSDDDDEIKSEGGGYLW